MLGPAPDTGQRTWHVEGMGGAHMDGTRDAYVVVDAAGRRICRPCTDLSDARLIAAAPELLEAAETALETLRQCCKAGMEDDTDSICGGDCRFCEIYTAKEKLQAAIAKAQGRDADERDAD